MRDDLPHAMRETARKLEPDVVRLAAGGVSRGTRMRRVERAVQVLGSAVAVAVVFGGVALFGHAAPSAGSPPETGSPDTSSPGALNAPENGFATATPPIATPPTVTAPTTTAATTAPTTTATAPGSSDASQISDSDLEGLLKAGLSGTGVTGRGYSATSSLLTVGAQLTDGTNVGFITIVISAPGAAVPGPGAPDHLKDRSLVYVSEAPGTSDGRHPDKTELTVTLVRQGGVSLTALETNAPSVKSAAVPGAPLLLQEKQIVAMLDSPAWDAAAATVTTASPPSAPTPQ